VIILWACTVVGRLKFTASAKFPILTFEGGNSMATQDFERERTAIISRLRPRLPLFRLDFSRDV
jgi:hypothetical protein